MKTTRRMGMAAVAFMAVSTLTLHLAQAQQAETKRSDLQRHDLSTRVETGDVLFVPAGTSHTAKNIGSTKAAELATYVVEKGKPLLTPVK